MEHIPKIRRLGINALELDFNGIPADYKLRVLEYHDGTYKNY
jgi:hypothetical protein